MGVCKWNVRTLGFSGGSSTKLLDPTIPAYTTLRTSQTFHGHLNSPPNLRWVKTRVLKTDTRMSKRAF